MSCRVCGLPADFRCSRCHRAWYCSKLCQRADWPNHKQEEIEYLKSTPGYYTYNADNKFSPFGKTVTVTIPKFGDGPTGCPGHHNQEEKVHDFELHGRNYLSNLRNGTDF